MGKSAARLGDIGSGHGGYPPTPITAGSGNVTINGRPAARMGDSLLLHAKPKSPPHGRSIGEGSPCVSINGRPAARVGDKVSCGGKVSTGSGNVSIGDTIVLTPPDDASLPDIVFDRNGKIQKVVEREQQAKQRKVMAEAGDIAQPQSQQQSQQQPASQQLSSEQQSIVKQRFSFLLSG